MQGVGDSPAVSPLLLKPYRLAVEVQPGEGRFAALPNKRYFGHILTTEILLDVRSQDLIAHLEARASREQLLLLRIEAVGAVEIARRSDRLRHEMKTCS